MYNIIICDDELTIRKGLRHLIESSDAKCTVAGLASNGFEAIQLINEMKPEVALMDINMPGKTGLEVIRHTATISPFTKFIIISGYDEFEYAQEAIQLKAFDYLLKPIVKNDLLAVIEKAYNASIMERKAYADYSIDEDHSTGEKAIHYIYEHYNDSELTLKKLSQKLHISESYLTRIFKKKTNMNFSEFLTKVRIEAAISLILSSDSLSSLTISEKVGYKSQHYFCKVFKGYTSMSPTEYRKNHVKDINR